ncbi:molybdate ABC transporter substrate-binding protein [Pseudoduganella eburnea]|uniref:Molybdate ABC transporter substrate-binding protein n=1 Tax=Massilia eburnea TaxID=1776165 RepID=A0A6L6QBP4_9BURK|nr:molybdate ABC transporter substrate-binding protein [Massilia eburnea]MTW09217.1 molybdate ABC transporter substrate-binding protein [Massilia eburnea]
MKRITAVLLLCAAGASSAADITVSAAASLNNAFREAASAYEAAHPGDKVLLNFGSSDALVAQIAKGAPVDLFASADQEAMDKAQPHIAAGSRRDFASNRLVVAVPVHSTLRLSTLADLGQPGVKRLTTGNPASVPVGRYTKAALEKSGQWPVLEQKFVFATNVRQALDYVARGEVEAGFVYQTDVASQADKVRSALAVLGAGPIIYPLAVMKGAPNAAGARAFADFIMSAGGQAILARHGFGKP